MSYYGFIFARGGSKRIKDKNIVDFHGIPLISHVIETCKKCKYIQDIIVSTDSEKIAKIAKQSDAKIIKRPSELATDNVSQIMAWKHAIKEMKMNDNDIFISIPVVTPLKNERDIDNCIEKYMNNKCDIITTMYKNDHVAWSAKINSDKLLVPVYGNHWMSNRQEAETYYTLTSVCHVSNVRYIKKAKHPLEGRVLGLEIKFPNYIDIDTQEDLELCRKMKNN